MKIIFETEFGSHLYGSSTPQSDRDFKGIILPTKREILLGRAEYHIDKSTNKNNTKNSSDDVDRTYYTLSYFIKLACQGETVALDMLHGKPSNWLIHGDIWDFLVQNRSRFYSKSMKSYIGYVRKQAAKYGVKGSRIGEVEKMLNFLKELPEDEPVGNFKLEGFDHGEWIIYKDNSYYEFLGSKYQDTLKIKYMIENLQKIYNTYGERSKLAKTNEGVDWKALYHALRAGYQARSIYLHGGFEYPLKENSFLMEVKAGKLDFLNEVEPALSAIVDEVMELADKSTYPEKIDYSFWEDFIEIQHTEICKC